MGYAVAVRGLIACPFCREMFPATERSECPHCGVVLVSLSKLPPPVEHDPNDELDERDREAEPVLPWGYFGLARGPLFLLAVAGLAAFCLPWVSSFAPERMAYTGIDLARRTGVGWSAGVAWFTMIPIVLSRRTVSRMRGARLAVTVLAVIPGIVAATLLLNPPQAAQAHGVIIKMRYAWQPAIYATVVISLATAIVAALRFGGPGAASDDGSAGEAKR